MKNPFASPKHQFIWQEKGIYKHSDCTFDMIEDLYLVTYQNDEIQTTLIVDKPYAQTPDKTFVFILGDLTNGKMDDITLHKVLKAKLAREAMSRVEELSDEGKFPFKIIIIAGIIILALLFGSKLGIFNKIGELIHPTAITQNTTTNTTENNTIDTGNITVKVTGMNTTGVK